MAITDTARQAQRKAQHWELMGSADASYGVHHGVTNDTIVRYVIQNRWPLYRVTDAAARRAYISGIRRRLREYEDIGLLPARRADSPGNQRVPGGSGRAATQS